jgi:HTH domain
MIANGKPTTARKSSRRKPRSIDRPKSGYRFRFETFNAFIDLGMAKLTPYESAVWFVLYRDAKAPDETARTAVGDIARRTGISRRTVINAIARMRELKMLRVVKQGGLNCGASTYLVFPVPME